MTDLPPVHALIPHRGRWLLIDRLVTLRDGELTAAHHVSLDQVEGHFPGQPVMPGVALLEGMAQTTACLAALTGVEGDGVPYLAAFSRVRFRHPVRPPADVLYRVRLGEHRGGLTQAHASAWLGDVHVASAVLTATRLPTHRES